MLFFKSYSLWLHVFVRFMSQLSTSLWEFLRAAAVHLCAPARACEKAICQGGENAPSTYRVITGPLDRHDWARGNFIQNAKKIFRRFYEFSIDLVYSTPWCSLCAYSSFSTPLLLCVWIFCYSIYSLLHSVWIFCTLSNIPCSILSQYFVQHPLLHRVWVFCTAFSAP
jgi:hypothetical protein